MSPKNNAKKSWSPSDKAQIYPENVGLVKFDELAKFFRVVSAGCSVCGKKWSGIQLKPFGCCIKAKLHCDCGRVEKWDSSPGIIVF